MTLEERIARGLSDVEDARMVRRMMAALAALMAAYPVGARETVAYRLAEYVLSEALAERVTE